ncbi:MAG TPA: hypothetical protein DCM05_11565 [Elusimicrobia bacterium]|nr:hypothetical protein [Elusimicrobiota bacterium]
MLRFGAILSLLLLFSSCKKAPESKVSGLQEMAARVRYDKSCAKKVYMEYARSYPLPALSGGQRIYRLFFYPLDRRLVKGQNAISVLAPVAAARFNLETGEGGCESLSTPIQADPGVTLGPRLQPEIERMGMRQLDLMQAELYTSLENVSSAYFDRRSDPSAQEVASDFFDRFLAMSEPGFKPYYYYLSPDFWEWMEKTTGRKLF